MQITEIRVKLADNHQERLLAFCTITFASEFVIRDVKIIEGPRGPFVAMPSRKVTARCPKCRDKNHMRANYCNTCGERLDPNRLLSDPRQRPRLYVDIAHPINQRCRATLESACVQAFHDEVERSRMPGYTPPDIDGDLDHDDVPASSGPPPRPARSGRQEASRDEDALEAE